MPLTVSKISFLAIIANSLKMTLTNMYFFKMVPSSRLFLINTQPLPLGGSGEASALVGVAVGLA